MTRRGEARDPVADSSFITLPDVRESRSKVAEAVIHTPILPLRSSARAGVYGKCENLQNTGAFKIRGAYNKISRLPASCAGVVAYSSGNHGRAVATAARTRGLRACVVMYGNSSPDKVQALRSLGAELILDGSTSEALRVRAEREVRERGFMMVPPFNDPQIMAGQATLGLEILEDLPGVKAIVAAIGGGGLLGGLAAAVKESRPDVKVFGVQAEGAPGMLHSLLQGKVVTLEKAETVADGLRALRPGELTFAHVRRYVDDVITVSDAEILAATRALLFTDRMVVEPAGAAALAAIASERLPLPPGPVVAVLSGGNVDVRIILGSEDQTR
jgi:threonine dehydratase